MKAITIIPLTFWVILLALVFFYYAFGIGGVALFAGIATLLMLAGVP